MPRDKVKVVISRKLPKPIEQRMVELFDAELNATDEAFTENRIADALERADVFVSTVTDKIHAGLIAKAGKQLKMIAQFGAGVDNIDVKAAAERGIVVTNTPGVLTEDTADMTMALILALPRRMVQGVEALRRGEFEGWSPTWMLGHRIFGKRIGIIGMGRIGQAVARRARAFGLEVHYHNRNRVSPAIEAQFATTYWESLDQMISRMDIISINCPATPATYHLMHERRLRLLKPHAYIINTSRGEVIDEEALISALEAGQIAGAGLDVFENEPEINPRLLALKNVILIPHMGSATIEARTEMGEKVIINIKNFLDGHMVPDRVIPDLI
ncbi:2-hydroxyacid dehydrogenase [Hirschia litorea]|uniref:2-hydroxyacid dehydrogenase n=1 Tax=Hirschia litorea TaxID=1199156 RepID=A0ABW2IMN4_9PROT